jgi:SNF2 family DNA or RNA helicase
MTDELYPYQADVLGPIANGDPTYLGFDPGLGKSRTALEAAKARGVERLLIIGPASSRYVWERECAMWWPKRRFRLINGPGDLSTLKGTGLFFITYGLLSQKDSVYAAVLSAGKNWDMTVLDEAAYLKNSGANRTKAILGKMLPKLGFLLPLSGTPAPNHAGELYTILRAVYPQALIHSGGKTMTEWEFQDAFCQVTNRKFGNGPVVRVIEGSKNLPALRKRLDGFMRRVKKEDVLKDLPPVRWDVVPIQPSTSVQIPALPQGLSDDEFLKYLSGATGDEHVMRIRRLLGLAKSAGSIEYIDDFLNNLSESRKVLVFAHHREVIQHLEAGLGNHSPAVVTGSSTPTDRRIAIDRFLGNDKCRVFIGNIQAAGTALTLVGPKCRCSDVFFVEASYAVGDNVQAAARVHRIGQRDAVVARMLTAHGTIDDRIQDILARKAGDFNQLFN